MAGIGQFTGCDLSGVSLLAMPWEENNGLLQPPFSQGAALLSFELASAAYDMKMDDWREAGWRDISYQVDNTLLTGPAANTPVGSGIGGAISGYFQRLTQFRLKRQDPVSQIRGALRQKDVSDTCKAVVMIHPLFTGKYLVAIGFMGTGKRFYDWFSNFRLSQDEGVHSGFLQLTKEFEKNCDAISFPETARELGLEKLTLADILLECRRPGSRFRLWMAGHSQGGSVMQLFALRETRRGFLRQNMIGYGFASPSVLYEHPGYDPNAFPLFHIINADDSFPRMGAVNHVGRCRVFDPDEEMRSICYKAAWDRPLFRDILRLMRQVGDSGGAFLYILSLLRCFQSLPADEAMAALNSMVGSVIPDMVLGALGTKKEDILQSLIRKATQAYLRSANADAVPEDTIKPLQSGLQALIGRYGAADVTKTSAQCLGLPHKLRGTDAQGGAASYQYIVTRRFQELGQQIWCASRPRLDRGKRAPRYIPQRSRFAGMSQSRERRNNR